MVEHAHVIICLLGFDYLDLLCFGTLILCYKCGLVFDWQRAVFHFHWQGALIGLTGVRWLVEGWLVHSRIQKALLIVVHVMTAAGVFTVLVFNLV